MSTRGDFIKFFFLIYLANMAAAGAGYSLFYLSKSLELMDASSSFTLFALDLARLTTIVCMLFLRKYSDHISKQRMSLIGAWLTFFAFLGVSFSSGTVWILCACVLFGVSAATVAYLGAIMFDYVAPENRMRIFGYFATSYSLSSLLGAFLTDLLFPIGVHHQTTGFPQVNTWGFFNPLHFLTDVNPSFMLLSGCIMALIWVVSTTKAKTYEKRLPFYGVTTQEDKDYKPKFLDYKTPMGMTLLLGISWMSLMSLIPSFSIELGIVYSSLFFTGFGIFAVLGRFFVLPHTDRIGRRNIVYISFLCYVLSFACILVLPLSPSGMLLFLAGVFCGMGHGILYTVLNILFTEVTPKHTGNATFVFTAVFQIGNLLVMPLGLLVDTLGYLSVFIGLFVLIIVVLGGSLMDSRLQSSLRTPNFS